MFVLRIRKNLCFDMFGSRAWLWGMKICLIRHMILMFNVNLTMQCIIAGGVALNNAETPPKLYGMTQKF